jgi:hypothetical protein
LQEGDSTGTLFDPEVIEIMTAVFKEAQLID